MTLTRNSSIEIVMWKLWKTYTCLICIKRAEKRSAPLQIASGLDKILVGWTNRSIDAPCDTRPADVLSPLLVIQGLRSPSPKLLEPSLEEMVRLFCPARVLGIILPIAVRWPPWFWSESCSPTYKYMSEDSWERQRKHTCVTMMKAANYIKL